MLWQPGLTLDLILLIGICEFGSISAGRAMGLALLHGEVLPGAHFTPNFLKGLLGQPAQLDDLRGNPPVHKFLKQLLAGQFR